MRYRRRSSSVILRSSVKASCDPMSTEPTRLIDYRPPAWRVRDVALRFELDFAETRVFACCALMVAR